MEKQLLLIDAFKELVDRHGIYTVLTYLKLIHEERGLDQLAGLIGQCMDGIEKTECGAS